MRKALAIYLGCAVIAAYVIVRAWDHLRGRPIEPDLVVAADPESARQGHAAAGRADSAVAAGLLVKRCAALDATTTGRVGGTDPGRGLAGRLVAHVVRLLPLRLSALSVTPQSSRPIEPDPWATLPQPDLAPIRPKSTIWSDNLTAADPAIGWGWRDTARWN